MFPYNFPVMLTFYSEASVLVNYIAQREGGFDKLKGKKIATLYHDSAYGRETLDPLALLSKKYGFEDIEMPIAHPGNEQSAHWSKVSRLKPDWVFLRGWGVMTPVAIKTAARVGYPAEHIIGDVWSSSEEDVIPAGNAAKGYLSITTYPAGADFELHKRIKAAVVDKGKSNLKNLKSFGSVYYNSGLIMAIVTVEAIRAAQAHFGKRPLNGEEGSYGLEHINVDEARIKQLGVEGLLQPLALSCSDHEGGGAARIQQWDGEHWKTVSDWVKADRELLRPLIDKKAQAYATGEADLAARLLAQLTRRVEARSNMSNATSESPRLVDGVAGDLARAPGALGAPSAGAPSRSATSRMGSGWRGPGASCRRRSPVSPRRWPRAGSSPGTSWRSRPACLLARWQSPWRPRAGRRRALGRAGGRRPIAGSGAAAAAPRSCTVRLCSRRSVSDRTSSAARRRSGRWRFSRRSMRRPMTPTQ